MRPKTLFAWIAGVLIALAAVVYASDFASFEYRVRNAKPNDPLETVTFYYATAMKNGKVEVFYDQPQTQTCVHAIFPHQGYRPCWRLSRSGIQRISRMIPRLGGPLKRTHLAGWADSERQCSGRGCGHGDRTRSVLPHRTHGEKMIIRRYAL